MRRLAVCAALSLSLYFLLFGLVLDRPLSLEPLRLELLWKAGRLAALPSPKLVIIAGSNGPYSHSCAVIGPMLGLACENAGIAVGIGLDEIFTRYAPALRPGDIVYMPMELEQYAMTRAEYNALVDGALLLRHDKTNLATLPPGRVAGALFCCTLGDALEALVEMPLAALHWQNPAAMLARQYNTEGDRVDNLAAGADAALLSGPARAAPSAAEIQNGYGAWLIARFVAQERARGIRIIGGWPVDFTDARVSAAARAAVLRVYGGDFLNLPGQSLYPRADFFNSEDHLARPFQIRHSITIALGLAGMLGRKPAPPDETIKALAWNGSPSEASPFKPGHQSSP